MKFFENDFEIKSKYFKSDVKLGNIRTNYDVIHPNIYGF